MDEKVAHAVDSLLNLQKEIASLSSEERMLLGEKASSVLRHNGLLDHYGFINERYVQTCSIGTKGLAIRISCETEPGLYDNCEIPF